MHTGAGFKGKSCEGLHLTPAEKPARMGQKGLSAWSSRKDSGGEAQAGNATSVGISLQLLKEKIQSILQISIVTLQENEILNILGFKFNSN